MPLLKLWNSIRGRSAQTEPKTESGSRPDAERSAAKTSSKGNNKPSFGLFGGGPHAGLCKLVKSVSATSVLEISIDDGSRAAAVLETLAKTHQHVRYVAIDQFEMGGSGVTLKQFHQYLRAKNIRPQVIPETIQRGLIRVAHTIGAVDMVVIAAPMDQWQTPTILPLLSKISHENTVVLCLEGEVWKRFQADRPGYSQRGIQRAA